MTEVVSLAKHRKEKRKQQGRQSTLCGKGFHSWDVVKDSIFDVKLGKLVTQFRCRRCGAEKNEAR